jgi:hypothetical protein
VPWDERNLVDQVKALLPEGQAVVLRDNGITELPLARLNARLGPEGYVIHASTAVIAPVWWRAWITMAR